MKAGGPETEDQRIGKLIRILRHKADLNQTELAQALGISFQQIQKYEKGVNRVASSRLRTLAAALGVSPSYFFEKQKTGSNLHGEDVLGLLADKRAYRMLLAFSRIESNKLKDSIISLVEKLSGPSGSK